MTNGTITIDLQGATLDQFNQIWFIEAKAGEGFHAAAAFLKAHKDLFDRVLQMGQIWRGLRGTRINKFRAYAERNGFKVEHKGR